MQDFDELDLLDDDGDGVIEISLLEEEETRKKGGSSTKSGCSIVFLVLDSSLLIAGWSVIRMIV